MDSLPNYTIFYDGECGMCNRAVQFVLQHETEPVFHFASLQGKLAKVFLPQEALEADSLVLFEGGELYLRTQAVFRIAWHMGSWWRIPGLLRFLPPVIFDWGYRWVAQNRYRMFQKGDQCILPNAEQKKRFLD